MHAENAAELPTSDDEILLGKTLAALIPTMSGIWGGSVVFMVLMDRNTAGALGYDYFPNASIAVILLALAPLAGLFSIEISVLLSAWATDVRTVQQMGSLLFLPFILLYVLSEAGVVVLNATNLLLISGLLAVVVLGLFGLARRTFHREEILTRWR